MNTIATIIEEQVAKGYTMENFWARYEEHKDKLEAQAAQLTDEQLVAMVEKVARNHHETAMLVMGYVAEQTLNSR